MSFKVYSHDADKKLIDSDVLPEDMSSGGSQSSGGSGGLSVLFGTFSGNQPTKSMNFSELMPGSKGETVSKVITDSYELLYGSWPENYDEVILVLNENNGIPAEALYQLGLITRKQYDEAVEK